MTNAKKQEMNDENMRPFETDVSRLLDIVANALYSNRDVFLRELISNSADACDRLRYEALSNANLIKGSAPFNIAITPDRPESTLTIADNGIGMNQEELVENLGTIARSGTAAILDNLKSQGQEKDMSLIGQFGVGFYASFMVAKRVEVVSSKAGDNQTYHWESDGKTFRKMATAKPNDFILVNGIMVGRATKARIEFVCKNGYIIDIQGCRIKQHGIEKLDRFGYLDIGKAKIASTSSIRNSEKIPRIQPVKGSGVSFIDHAGMHVFDLAHNVEGVVTVGDDTTTVVADILYRNQIPVIGIIDGDRDTILNNPHYTSGSVLFTVPEDDEFGLKVFDTIFQNNQRLDMKFDEVLEQTEKLAQKILVKKRVY